MVAEGLPLDSLCLAFPHRAPGPSSWIPGPLHEPQCAYGARAALELVVQGQLPRALAGSLRLPGHTFLSSQVPLVKWVPAGTSIMSSSYFLIASLYSRAWSACHRLFTHLLVLFTNTFPSTTPRSLNPHGWTRMRWEGTCPIDQAGPACWHLSPGFLWKWLFPHMTHLPPVIIMDVSVAPFVFGKLYFLIRNLLSNCSPSSPPACLPWTGSWREDHSCYKWK